MEPERKTVLDRKSRRTVELVAILAAATAACGLFASSCSNGNSAGAPGTDGGSDSRTADAPAEAGETPSDAASDTPSSSTDSGATTSDASDASSPGMPLDFGTQVAAAYCGFLARCCGSSSDASTWNSKVCINSFVPGGFHGSNVGLNLLDGGNVAFNPTAAQACLDNFNNTACNSNSVSDTFEQQGFANCYAAVSGVLSAAAPCRATIECSPGNYCSPVDGGVGDAGAIGLCTPLAGSGGSCTSPSESVGENLCSYRGGGNTGLFCQTFNPSNNQALDAGSWTCAPQEGVGANCLHNIDCQSFLCNGSLQCGTSQVVSAVVTCAAYLILDAGGD